jgi:hypothetical protein
MDPQHLIDAALGSASLVMGWFARELWAVMKELKADLAKLREDLPRTYVAREDYRSDLKDVKEMLNKIFDRLDTKVDK